MWNFLEDNFMWIIIMVIVVGGIIQGCDERQKSHEIERAKIQYGTPK
jgi:hypothetical protein